MKLMQIKNEIIKKEKNRKEKAYLEKVEAARNEAQHKIKLQIIKNAIVQKEKTRKELAALKIVENKKRKAQLEAIKKNMIDAERTRKQRCASGNGSSIPRNVPTSLGNVPTLSGNVPASLGTLLEEKSEGSEKSEDEIHIENEVERIMNLKDERLIAEEICKLNKVNAAKGQNRRTKSEKFINGINSHINNEGKVQSKLNEIKYRVSTIDEEMKTNSNSILISTLPVKTLKEIKKDIIDIEKKRKMTIAKAEENKNLTGPGSVVAHATLVKETKSEMTKKVIKVENKEEKDIVSLIPILNTPIILRH